MNSNQRKASGAPQVTVFENPGPRWTLGLPGERKNAMAGKKKTKANKAKRKGGSKKNKKSISASSRSSSSTSVRKPNPKKKKGGRKRNTSSRKSILNNPLAALGNVSLVEWGTFALFAIASPTLASLLAVPNGWLNIGIQFGLTAAAAKFAPKSVKTAAVFGAGGPAVVSLVNKLTGNVIGTTIQRYIGPIIPVGLLGTGAPAPVQQTNNMAGLPQRRYAPYQNQRPLNW
jgi:hypothetical protein